MNDYLWDRTGTAEPDVEELERLLAPFGLTGRRPEVRQRTPWGAIAAMVALGALGWSLVTGPQRQLTDWAVGEGGRRLYAGEQVKANGTTVLESEEVGRVELGAGSVVQVAGASRMELREGTLHALIWAPPKKFVVNTPSARAIDLGCQYDLTVNARGDGWLRVETGWVAFQAGRRESFIPAGAVCRTSKMRGPGIPYFEDAPRGLAEGIERYERGEDGLGEILKSARREDGLTLWHLLSRVRAEQRGMVYDRFAALVPLPEAASRDRVTALETGAMDLCWNALGLSDAEWWREWKRDWERAAE